MVARIGGPLRATMRGSTRGRITARPTTQYLAARTRNAAGVVLDPVLGVVCVPESPPMFGQPPWWSRGAGVLGAGVAGVVGVVGSAGAAAAVVEGVSLCRSAERIQDCQRKRSAGNAQCGDAGRYDLPHTVHLSLSVESHGLVDSHRHHALRHVRTGMKPK